MSPYLLNTYTDAVVKEVRELGLSGLLCVDNLVLCGESEEDLRAMEESFIGM